MLGSEQAMQADRDMSAARHQQPEAATPAQPSRGERQIIQDIRGDAGELITESDILDYEFSGAAPVR